MIHFSHGRKLAKQEIAPADHAAKHIQEYLQAIEPELDGPVHQCYSHLCNFTHPAADSVLYLLEKNPVGAISFRESPDADAIGELCRGGGTVAAYSLSESLIVPVMILRVLNHFSFANFQAAAVESITLSEIPAWREIEPLLRPDQ